MTVKTKWCLYGEIQRIYETQMPCDKNSDKPFWICPIRCSYAELELQQTKIVVKDLCQLTSGSCFQVSK
jgi:hypothetical protein